MVMQRIWQPIGEQIEFKSDQLADLRPLLERIVATLGTNAAGRLLGVDPAQVTRWTKGNAPISSEMGHRILDLYDVLVRALRLFARDVAARWLFGSEPLLGGARPIDVLAQQGAVPVIQALEGIAQGAYA